ncbi:MAG: NAD-dependent dihydropyrimidine dehydrogenase subunit PreA [Eubacteriales bacterium]
MAVKKDLSINYLGVKCENPFFLSSSPVGSNYEMVAKAYEAGWGGVFYKTIGVFIADECSPRFDIVNKEGTPWMGFKNMEQISDKQLDVNLENIFKLKRDYPDKVMVATIMGSCDEEWVQLSKMVTDAGADLIECNFSCPQMTTHSMGSDVGTNVELVEQYSRAVASATHLPVIAKMTPNLANMEPPALAALKGGAKGISAINTVKSITNIDFENMSGMPVVNGKSSISGYSGAAIKPIALRFVAQLMQHPEIGKYDISGVGGIETWRDAVEFLLLGAKNIQVTTSVMQYGYRIVEDMINGTSHFMNERGYNKVDDFLGLALKNLIPAEDLDRGFKLIAKINDDKCIGCGRCYISCYDAAHQAITWDEAERKPAVDRDKCVGCHLCLNVCPVMDCIVPGDLVWKEGRAPHDVKIKKWYE